MNIETRFRYATLSDAAPLAGLADELGYPITKEEMTRRLAMLVSQPHHGIVVAELESIVGWIHVSLMLTLESEAFAEIRGLVVTASHRGSGIGTHLVILAEDWAKAHGCNRIRVRTNVTREKSRRFYIALALASSPSQAQKVRPTILERDSVIAAAREIMGAQTYCALITIDSSGQPQARTMNPFPPDNDMTVWIATNSRSRKVRDIRKNPRVCLYYARGMVNDPVTWRSPFLELKTPWSWCLFEADDGLGSYPSEFPELYSCSVIREP